jgi:hypothetical protein
MVVPLGDMAVGDWFAWDRGFGMVLESRTVHVKIATFTANGVFRGVKSAAKTTTAEYQCSRARNVPWERDHSEATR